MQNLHPGQKARFSLTPACNFCPLAWLQNFHSGLYAKSAQRPTCNFCKQGIRRAKFAREVGAKSARLESAKFARDSYRLLNYDSFFTFWWSQAQDMCPCPAGARPRFLFYLIFRHVLAGWRCCIKHHYKNISSKMYFLLFDIYGLTTNHTKKYSWELQKHWPQKTQITQTKTFNATPTPLLIHYKWSFERVVAGL